MSSELATNVLSYGDNLDILRRYLPDAGIDQVYRDPPFNSNRDDNVIFRDEPGKTCDAQLLAVEDTWHAWSIGRGDLRLPDQHRPPRGPRAGQGQHHHRHPALSLSSVTSLEDVLGRGYFPKELPGAFTTATYAGALRSAVPTIFKTGGGPRNSCLHSLARPGTLVRTLSIPDPVHFHRLANLIVTDWGQIQTQMSRSTLSITQPVDDPRAVRAWTPPDSPTRPEARAEHAAHSRFRITADVSQWYPSTYTHSLDWAIRGKEIAKADSRRRSGLGPMLDTHTREAQDRQSIGLPIGPDTSFVLGELVLAQVDAEFTTSVAKSTHGFRFYDDYELFAPNQLAVDRAIHALVNALAEWQLVLNPHKLEIVQLPVPIEDEWTSAIRRFRIRTKYASQERSDLNALFDEAFRLAKRFPREQVLAYTMGRFVTKANKERRRVDSTNWRHFEKLILHASLGEPGVLPKAGHLIYWARSRGLVLDREAVAAAINLLAYEGASRGHSSEVAWSIWLAILLNIRIQPRAARAIARLRDDVVALTALHASRRRIIRRLDTSAWRPLMTAAALQSEHWLIAYEALVHGWLPSADGTDYVAADAAFAYLRSRNVRFYDEMATIPPSTTVGGPIPTEKAAEPIEPLELEEEEVEEGYGG